MPVWPSVAVSQAERSWGPTREGGGVLISAAGEGERGKAYDYPPGLGNVCEVGRDKTDFQFIYFLATPYG